MGDWYRQSLRNSNEIGERRRRHLLHHVPSMDLESDFADSKLGGGLLVEQATHDQRQHLALSRRQLEIALPQSAKLGTGRSRFSILSDRSMDGSHQIGVAEGLGQEIDSPSLDRSNG